MKVNDIPFPSSAQTLVSPASAAFFSLKFVHPSPQLVVNPAAAAPAPKYYTVSLS
jgi:hypothetical protein